MGGTSVTLGARSGPLPETACHAPSVQLFLNPNGDVVPCARHLVPLGNVTDRSLLEIWQGTRRRALRSALAAHDYSLGCENCGAEAVVEGTAASYAGFFDTRAGHLGEGPGADAWPRYIDFNLSNACNLQCLQCSGELSSAIRIHRERRAPLPSAYDDRFFEELRLFIPHLDQALFAGGEPFLAPENYRVWDLIAEMRPDLPITVTTNATQWSSRIGRVLDRLRFSFVISIDGIRHDTYAAIRHGGDLDVVLANIERFRRYAARVGTSVSLNHCLMVQNHHEFADLLLWAEDRDLDVTVSVVRAPSTCSLLSLPAGELATVHAGLLARDDEVRGVLSRNLATWDAEVHRIGAWAASAAASPEGHCDLDRRVLLFRSVGAGPSDARSARVELAELAVGGLVLEMAVGLDGRIESVSPSASELGIAPADLVGRPFDAVETVAVGRWGPRSGFVTLRQDDDRADLAVRYGSTDVRICLVACRDGMGVATGGRILLALVSGSPLPRP